MKADQAKQFMERAHKNARLKRLLVDAELEKPILKEGVRRHF